MKNKNNEIPIEELINIFLQGHDEVFKEIVSRYQSYIFSLAYKLLKNCNDSEDIVQESFIRVWKNINRYDNSVKFSTWLYRIVVNLCYDKLKQRKRKQKIISDEEYVDELSKSTYDPENELTRKEFNKIVLRFTEELSYRQKIVFTLRDLQDLSIEEVAGILQISEGSVKTNLVYARKSIKQKIEKFYTKEII